VTVTAPEATRADTELRSQLSDLQCLLMLSMLMTESGDEGKILQLAATSVPSFGHTHLIGVRFTDGNWWGPGPAAATEGLRDEVQAQVALLDASGGAIAVAGQGWTWALPLRVFAGHLGYFIVAAAKEPAASEQFLLRVLAQQTGVALGNSRLHTKERSSAEELRAANAALAETVRALEQSTQIHDRFTRVAMAGEGQDGVARALHELTGYPVAVEDRYGNLRAWAGPNRPDPYPKDPQARREQMLRRALREGRPIREGGRLVALASPSAEVLGVLALIDPAGAVGDREQIAIEHGATVLAMELARLRSLAEAELRLRRDLVEELLSGTEEEGAVARAQALGHDLEQRNRVVVAEGRGRVKSQEPFFHAVRRAARDLHVGSLLVARGDSVVLISDADLPWERFRMAILTELGGGRCSLGVGGWCSHPRDLPRSYREGQLALQMQGIAHGKDRATCYDDLGVYRILCEVQDGSSVERFVRQWLGTLLEYDERKHSDLVTTLTQYLECGGSYDATALALSVHRSTLKYRLQRIREISGHNLTDPDTNFNLQLATRAWRTLQTLQA
jgi:DNA-binding PucR family transcriptional regulator